MKPITIQLTDVEAAILGDVKKRIKEFMDLQQLIISRFVRNTKSPYVVQVARGSIFC